MNRLSKRLTANIIFLIFLIVPPCLYAGKKDSLVHTVVDRNVFLDQEKFMYLKEDLSISILLEKRKDVRTLTGVLFSAVDNNNVPSTLLLDWEAEREHADILLLNRERVSKFQIREAGTLFNDSAPTPVHFYANIKQDSSVLVIGGHTIKIQGMGFTIKNGYKFSILPVLSVSPEPNTLPVLKIEQMHIEVAKRSFFESTWYWFVLIIVADLLIFLWIHLKRRKKRRRIAENAAAYTNGETEERLQPVELPRKGAVYLFGHLQIYDKNGEDVTKRFSPLLKELLTAIIIYSPQKGISSDKLNEMFWFDKDRVSAKNNRAVNLGKLRTLLSLVGDYELSNDTGYWRLEPGTIFIDYLEFARRSSHGGKLEKEDIEMLMSITERGSLLPESEYAWLDSYKSDVSDTVLAHFWEYANSLNFAKVPELVIDMADRILSFENINEQALFLKCKALSLSGRHSSAKKVYDKFRLDYEAVYGVTFHTSFTDLLEKTSWD